MITVSLLSTWYETLGQSSSSLVLSTSISKAYPLAKCFTSITSAQSSFLAMSYLAFSIYIFRDLFPCLFNLHQWRVTTRLPLRTPVKQKQTHPSVTGFIHFSLVIMRKPLLHFQRDPGNFMGCKERCLLSRRTTNTHTHTCTNCQEKSSSTRKACEHSEHKWEGVCYSKCGNCTCQE